MSRPWNVREIDSSAYAGFASSWASAIPACSAAGSRSPLSGPTKSRPLQVAQGERAAMASHARIDDREVDAARHVGNRVGEHERALQHRLGRDAVGDVDDLRVWRNPLDHTVAGADEVVLEPEVGEKGDEHADGVYEPSAAGDGPSGHRQRCDGPDEPGAECSAASATMSRPAATAAFDVSGPIETTGAPASNAARALAAEAEATT